VKLPGSAGGWLAALIVTVVGVAIIFRVSAIKKVVTGQA
jgi:hypothetical protein